MTKVKTIFFVRHAESEENRKLNSMKRGLRDLSGFRAPSASDVAASAEWFLAESQNDTDLSEVGELQVKSMGRFLEEKDFLVTNKIELVVTSPLIRAKKTCIRVLGCDPSRTNNPVHRVVESDLLIERTMLEFAWKYNNYVKRLRDLEDWLGNQEEDRIILVGHSQYFKTLLGLDFKIGNCDVYRAEFLDSQGQRWANITRVFRCDDAMKAFAEENEIQDH